MEDPIIGLHVFLKGERSKYGSTNIYLVGMVPNMFMLSMVYPICGREHLA
jgi:hypothetical protein